MSNYSHVHHLEEMPTVIFEQDTNLTLASHNVTSDTPVDFFWWKTFLLTWDFIGIMINGLGIDMLWHGVEVNHAVYCLILQDICLAWVTTLVSQLFNWIFWSDDLSWFKFHGAFAMLPLIFHDWSWASVAYLR